MINDFSEKIFKSLDFTFEQCQKLGLLEQINQLAAIEGPAGGYHKAQRVAKLAKTVQLDKAAFFEPLTDIFGYAFVSTQLDVPQMFAANRWRFISRDLNQVTTGGVVYSIEVPVIIKSVTDPASVSMVFDMTADFFDGEVVENFTPRLLLDGVEVTSSEQAVELFTLWVEHLHPVN